MLLLFQDTPSQTRDTTVVFLTVPGSTLGKVHPAPRNWATSATKPGLRQLLHKVHENFRPTRLSLKCFGQNKGWSHSTLCLSSALTSVEQGFCSSPWIPYNGHCFHLNRSPQTWSNAQKECRKEEGDLVSIRNVEDQSFVISQLGYGT